MFNNKQQGFTLLEMLVAIAIFSIIMAVVSGVFGSILSSQEQVLREQLAVSNTSYALEYMSRAMRMAKQDTSGNCIDKQYNFQNPNDNNNTIRFLNHDEDCITFKLENEQIKGVNLNGNGETLPFTSQRLTIKELRFELQGEGSGDSKQPSVTILLRAETGQGNEFKAQTTVTQRNLDFAR